MATLMDSSDKNTLSAVAPTVNVKSRGFVGAALLMVLSVTFFSVSHGFVRGVGAEIHPFEIAFSTSLFSFLFYLPWLMRARFRPLRTERIGVHWVRAFFNASAVCGWYFALMLMPLADAVALALTGPLLVTFGAILFFGEPARLRRWVAMGTGIAGAILIIRPGFQAFSAGYWFVIFCLACTAGSRLITKQLTFSEAPAAIGAWMALLQVPITFALAIFFWTWPNVKQLVMMITVGLLVGAAHYTLTHAYDRAEVGALEPFNFVRLVIAALIGYVFFAETPDAWTWAGGAIIVASTSYIAHRETVRRSDRPLGSKGTAPP